MIREAIDQINEEIKALQKEKLELQKSCKHKKSSEKLYTYRPGVIDKVLMCDNCDILMINASKI